jgi:hypothetical protein
MPGGGCSPPDGGTEGVCGANGTCVACAPGLVVSCPGPCICVTPTPSLTPSSPTPTETNSPIPTVTPTAMPSVTPTCVPDSYCRPPVGGNEGLCGDNGTCVACAPGLVVSCPGPCICITPTPSLTPSSPTPTETNSPIPTVTQTATPLICVGDCDQNGQVLTTELIQMVLIALDDQPLSMCQPGDANHDGRITIDEITRAVGTALRGCETEVSPSATPSATSTPSPTPTANPLPPIVDCPGFETEREILSRTVADLWGPSGAKHCGHITCPSGEVRISESSSCLPNGVSAGFGYSTPFWVTHQSKRPFNVVSILRFDTEAQAAATLRGPDCCGTFNDCPALSIPQGYPPVEGYLYVQVSRWVFSVEEFDDGSSLLKSLGLDKDAVAQRMYEVGAELGIVCSATPGPTQ